MIVLLYFDMDILFICIQSLTFFPADSKTVTNSWNTAAGMTAEFSDIVLLSVGCVFIGLFCSVFFFFFFLFLWLFYFSTLAVIDCLIEVQSFAIPEPRVFLSQMWLKTSTFRLVLRERRTVLCCCSQCHCSLLTCHNAAPQTPYHFSTRAVRWSPETTLECVKCCHGVLTFLLVLFWRCKVQESFCGVHLDHCFICYCKEVRKET